MGSRLSALRASWPAALAAALLLVPAIGVVAGPRINNFTRSSNPWNAGTFAEAQLAGTGDQFSAYYTPVTATNAASMDVTANAGQSWIVSVTRVDTNWDDTLVLSVILSSNGTPAATAVTSPLPLTTATQPFFQGTGNCGQTSPITVSYSLQVSVLAGPGTYQTTVRYTIAAS